MQRLLKLRSVQIGFFSFALSAVFMGCNKQTLTKNVWRVEDVYENTDSQPLLNFEYPTLSFIGKDKYVFQSNGSCFIARVKIKGNHKIDFDIPSSIDGISEFAKSCLYLLAYSINHYEVSDYELVLTGDNGAKIKLNSRGFF